MVHWGFLGGIELLLLFCVVYTPLTNEWLRSYRPASAFVYLLIFYWVLANLSAVIRIKESAKNKLPELLCDGDLEYDVYVKLEQVHDLDCGWRKRFLIQLNNFIEFCCCYYAYGLAAAIGFIFVIIAFVMFIIWLNGYSQEMIFSAEIFVFFGFVLLLLVWWQIDNRQVRFREKYPYEPFDKHVKVPLDVFVAKILAAYLTGSFTDVIQLPIGLFFFINGYKASYFIPKIPKDDILPLYELLPEGKIYVAFEVISMVVIYVGAFLIFRAGSITYREAKRSLLITMEMNWQRNLHAMRYIIQRDAWVGGGNSLEEIQILLQNHYRQHTAGTEDVFSYLSLPLWAPKRGYSKKRTIS